MNIVFVFCFILDFYKNLKVFPPITKFEEINITKALTTPGRLHYPKVAKKSKLDEFLGRRTHLKLLEERQLSQVSFFLKITRNKNQVLIYILHLFYYYDIHMCDVFIFRVIF